MTKFGVHYTQVDQVLALLRTRQLHHRDHAGFVRVEERESVLASTAVSFDVSEIGSRFGFLPCDGGRLELFGVFGGTRSLASNSATRAVRMPTCAVSA